MTKRKLWRLIWWIYLTALIVLVVIKFRGSFAELAARIEQASQPGIINYNLIPLRTISIQLRLLHTGWAIYNLLGNFIPFIPFGFLLPKAYDKLDSAAKIFGVGVASIVFIELFQLVTRLGSFDVDDIIMNTIGIMCGYLFFRWTARRKNEGEPPSQSPPAAL
ncbi:MAG: VanZ family protein [Oscillospiraceae bacterium]|nr:VanZ family protein [Oscillospiraceae bacterium]